MTELTKKQLAAIQRVINRCERRYAVANDPYSGEIFTDDGICVTDGYIAIYYPESQNLKKNEKIDKIAMQKMMSYKEKFFGYHGYIVNEPFDMKLYDHPQTWLKTQMEEAPVVVCQNGDGIDLTARYGKWPLDCYKARFIRKDIIDACEAVGKNAACYLVKSENGIVSMLVAQCINGKLQKDEVCACIMPVRVREW